MLSKILDHLKTVAPDGANVPILQPADPFLETVGEDMRRRIFMTESADGSLKCLRPEFTIPICLQHDNTPARYSYGGIVFRQSREGAVEFMQAGLEDLGNTKTAEADAKCLADMLGALAKVGINNPAVSLGDQNLFGVVVENLKLPAEIAARLVRNFGEPKQIERLIDILESKPNGEQGNDEAHKLAVNGDEAALIAHVESLMAAGNLSPKTGRSAEAIAKRMIDKTRDASFRLEKQQAAILRNYLALELPFETAADELAKFAKDSGLDFGNKLETFVERVAQIKTLGVALDNITFKASFGRKLDYYTGVLFEAEVDGISVAGGGRYDRLCSLLGSEKPVPAVGFSISLDRVEEAT